MGTSTQTIVVIGLGAFGGSVALELARFGNHVIGIDVDEQRVSRYADDLDQALILDVRDEQALKEASLTDCDIGLIAIGTQIEASALAAINLKVIGIPKIWAKATSKNHHRILSRLGVDRVIHPEKEVGQHVAQVLHNPLVRDYLSLGNGYHIVNFAVPKRLQGKSLSSLPYESEYNLRCVGIMRGTEFLGNDGASCTLEKDDLLLLLGKRQDLRDFAGSI